MTDRILAVNFSTLIDKTLPGLFERGCFPQAFSKGFRHNVLALLKSYGNSFAIQNCVMRVPMISTNRTLFTLLLLLALAVSVAAQTYRGSIRGTITDPNNAVIPAATLTLVSNATNEQRTSVTDAAGEYVISSLPPGSYTLKVAAANFQTLSQDIVLRVNQELRVDASLGVGPIGADFEIVSLPADMKKDSASIGTVIANQQIVGLPLDGRNFYELSLLVPGAAPAAPGSAGSGRGGFAFSVQCARAEANKLPFDRLYQRDPQTDNLCGSTSHQCLSQIAKFTIKYYT